jgi:hypothetical protein
MKEIRENLRNDKFFSLKQRFNEDNNQINTQIVCGIEINKTYKYDQNLLIKAIQNGMIMTILYKGEDDKWRGGRERQIAPMVLGENSNTKNILIRAWHIDGYSIRERSNVEKVWRLFKVDNIKSITFTGDFIQLPPKNYKRNDRVMTERTIVAADFNEIRRNQNALLKEGKIEKEEETKLGSNVIIPNIKVEKTSIEIDLANPFNNTILTGLEKNPSEVKISILQSTKNPNDIVCLVGARGTKNRRVKVYEDKGGFSYNTYNVLEAFTADEFNKFKKVKNKSILPIFLYRGKK